MAKAQWQNFGKYHDKTQTAGLWNVGNEGNKRNLSLVNANQKQQKQPQPFRREGEKKGTRKKYAKRPPGIVSHKIDN